VYISPYCRLVLVPPIFMKLRIRGQLTEVITCVKFLVDRFRGYGVLSTSDTPKIAISHWLAASPSQQCGTAVRHWLSCVVGYYPQTLRPIVYDFLNFDRNFANFVASSTDGTAKRLVFYKAHLQVP